MSPARLNSRRPLDRCAGFSLVELMVAITLGLLISTVAVQFILSSRVTYNAVETNSRIQENARFALSFLARDLRMAGYSETGNLPGYFYHGPCGVHDNCTFNGTGKAFDGTGSASDQVAVWRSSPSGTDCTGTAVPRTSQLANVYTISTDDTTGVGTLYCRGWDVRNGEWFSSAQPLLDGVDNLQILFAVTGENLSVTQYLPASMIAASDLWSDIAAVRLMILASSGESRGTSDTRTRTYELLDAEPVTYSDRHTRKIFSTTVLMNNAST
jgi:type IV pilus assembly protein PilW